MFSYYVSVSMIVVSISFLADVNKVQCLNLLRPRIIVSFTTIDSRIDQIEPVVKSIFQQTMQPDSFELYVSDHPTLFKGGIDKGIPPNKIPAFLRAYERQGKIKINYVDNIGAANKLLPCLRENWGTDNVIITIDDDVRYPKDLVELLYKHYVQENCVIALSGLTPIFDGDGGMITAHDQWKFVGQRSKNLFHCPMGHWSCLYAPKFFTEMVFDRNLMFELAPLADDIWFYFMRLLTSTPALILAKEWHVRDLHVGIPGVRLSKFNNVGSGDGMNSVWVRNMVDYLSSIGQGHVARRIPACN